MLFIEAERMANGLYHPDDCESERTVIISELQGGENDPEQLLDQEVTAAAFKAHGYRHPTIGWPSDLQTMSARRSLRLLPPLVRAEQRHPRRSSATSDADDALRRVERQFGSIRAGLAARPNCDSSSPNSSASGACAIERPGTTAYLKVAWRAPAVAECRLLSRCWFSTRR